MLKDEINSGISILEPVQITDVYDAVVRLCVFDCIFLFMSNALTLFPPDYTHDIFGGVSDWTIYALVRKSGWLID